VRSATNLPKHRKTTKKPNPQHPKPNQTQKKHHRPSEREKKKKTKRQKTLQTYKPFQKEVRARSREGVKSESAREHRLSYLIQNVRSNGRTNARNSFTSVWNGGGGERVYWIDRGSTKWWNAAKREHRWSVLGEGDTAKKARIGS